MLSTVCLLLGIITITFGQQNGSIMRRSADGVVQVYYGGQWEGVCYDSTFGQTEADVVCHQLGYTSADSYSTTGRDNVAWNQNGTIANVDCGSNTEYQVLFQCSFDRTGCSSRDVLTVDCSSTSLSNDPFSGQVRLTGGVYSNEGVVEIYCNDKWGTLCFHNDFAETEAAAICTQLGYNNVSDYDATVSNTSPWLNNVNCGVNSQSCVTSCQSCPASGTNVTCSNNEVVSIECSYSQSSSSNTRDLGSCDFTELVRAIGQLIGIIVGVIVAIIVCAVFWTVLPCCICCCLGVGVCAAASKA